MEDHFGDEIEAVPAPFFRAPPILERDDLIQRTRRLAWEQRVVLNMVIGYCKDIVMTRSSTQSGSVEPPLIIVHGGAGTGKSFLIKILSFWVQKLLSQAGDDINSPYMIRAAPTGLAATNIDGQTVHSAFRLGFGNNYQSL